ncbi:MAG: hypothetical protein H7246_00370 [Phycisphaerae bacterium]|nr:hypothetical protein [Saprospiraceae bacterium]
MLLFFQPVIKTLSISGFSSIFEAFMAVGFAFYVLTKIDDFLSSTLGVESRTDQSITATINSNIELTKELIEESRTKNETDLALDISEHESSLINLKIEIEEERFRIIHNARFYFLLLGFHSLTMLVFCGMEDYCINIYPDKYKKCFYSALLFANIYFIIANILLTSFTFQHRKDEPIVGKILLSLSLLVIIIFTGIISKADLIPVEILISISIISIGVPFVLILNRHAKFKYILRKGLFENRVQEIRTKIGRAKIKLSKIAIP